LGLASVAFQTKDNDSAIEHARAALKAGAGDDARLLLGNAHFKKEEFDRAIDQYQAILKRTPGHRAAQKALREAEKQTGRGG
jgi:tetratricopeptide (TPR) repeat protein